MGYIHYFTETTIPADTWDTITTLSWKIAQESGVELRSAWNEATPPVFNADYIRLNGADDNGHETFLVRRDSHDWDFCKTNRKPYDTVVTAILALIVHLVPEFAVSSDGDPDDWEPGVALARKATGLDIQTPASIKT